MNMMSDIHQSPNLAILSLSRFPERARMLLRMETLAFFSYRGWRIRRCTRRRGKSEALSILRVYDIPALNNGRNSSPKSLDFADLVLIYTNCA